MIKLKIMYKILCFFMLVFGAACDAENCPHFGEIPPIFQIQDKDDFNKICKYYEANRAIVLTEKNAIVKGNYHGLVEGLQKVGVSSKSIESFIKSYKEYVDNHRETTKRRDSIYKEGLFCLKDVLATDFQQYKSELNKLKSELTNSLSTTEVLEIKEGVRDYLDFVADRKKYFLKEESLLYGEIGENITAYNQLSFDIILNIITSEYDHGLKYGCKEKFLSIYNQNPIFQEYFDRYANIEMKLTSAIMNEDCQKRVGVLRFYDDLGANEKLEAIKINMLMNVFR